MSSASRAKGHLAERELAKFFRRWHPYCRTTREVSRLLDSCGIDLYGIPILVQSKAIKGQLAYSSVLKYTEDKVKELLPPDAPEHNKPVIIVHKKTVGPGNKRTHNDTLVVMSLKTFEHFYVKTYDLQEHTGGDSAIYGQSSTEPEHVEIVPTT